MRLFNKDVLSTDFFKKDLFHSSGEEVDIADEKQEVDSLDVPVGRAPDGTPQAEFGQPKKYQGNFGTYINIICVLAGSGTLSLPLAFKQAGWFGIFVLLWCCIMATYCGRLLIKCLYYKEGKRLQGFPEVAQAAFGIPGKYFVGIFYNSILLGGPILYLILSATNMHQMLEPYNVGVSVKVWIVIWGCALLPPLIFFKTMKDVTLFGFFGAFATIFTIIVVSIAALVNWGKAGHPQAVHHPALSKELPTALGTIAFSYGGNVVLPHVQQVMKHPKAWSWVYPMAIFSVTAVYLLMGVVGYYVYGDDVVSPVYNNLPDSWYKTMSIIVITIHVLLATPIFLTSFSLEVEEIFKIDRKHRSATVEFILRAIVRTLAMAFVVVIGVVVPYFSDFMAFLGALSEGLLTFVFPVAFYIRLYGFRHPKWYELIFCVIVVTIGILGCIFGTKDAVNALKADFAKDN
ncbi:MAG: transmembrane amino acid transporter protein-domain-containing protein [Piptocephalis tieghemiana]|nr:MAG: transmembrane amino acid transporter protein-domain-containing protein [Piptocephalis tieghemiana]